MASNQPLTTSGKQLYAILPEVYRTRDHEAGGDLAQFLDACGELLDRLRATLDQRLADSFPDQPPAGRTCQEWLLPYFARLLDVRLVSPDAGGRREEVAQAVAWRQRKGTLTALEQIAEAVGQLEVEIREGWRQTAVTPRLGLPRLPAGALGESPGFDGFGRHPLWAARHPALPAATVNLRYPARALEVTAETGKLPANPAAKLTTFGGTPRWWRQANPHGAPCFPGSFEDCSRRTADLRTPDWRQGHSHPKRVILHAPPPLGFFKPGLLPVHAGELVLSEAREHLLEDLIIDGTLKVTAGTLRLNRCAVRNLQVTRPAGSRTEPVVTARECFFETLAVPGLARLEYTTILGSCQCGRLQASDSLFAGPLSLAAAGRATPHCLRFSRVPAGLAAAGLLTFRTTTERPVFQPFDREESGARGCRPARFGEPGCGVLHPAAPASIRFGAEDGGEMGAHHGWRYSLRLAAVLDKLKEFLPVGMEAVIVPDLRLRQPPWPPGDR